ncbi:MAG: DUF4340 domain-containing protein [Ruminococcaceae bacterium]|nr:DUF4340 domain-containing protein [Oscillospiraceae bacterium]
MKKRNSLILLLVVLVLAVGFFLVATVIADREAGNDSETGEQDIVYIDKDDTAVVSLTYRDKDKAFGIEVSGNTYYLAEDHAFPLDQTLASYMVSNVAKLTFERRFEAPSDLSEYGLDADTIAVTARYSDDTSLALTIGDYNKYADAYYCSVGDGFVYLLDGTFTDYFAYSMNELLLDETVTAPENKLADLTKIELAYRDGTAFSYVFVPAAEDGGEDTWQKVLADGTVVDGDMTDTVEDIYDELFGVKLEDWCDYNAVGDRLSRYGLDIPYLTVTVRYTKTVTITGADGTSSVTKEQEVVVGFLIGDLAEEETADTSAETSADTSADTDSDVADKTEPRRYFLLEGGQIVYRLGTDKLAAVLGA